MTTHYSNGWPTAAEVWAGWKDHGRRLPGAFLIASLGDQVAYEVWSYLQGRGQHADWPMPEKYCSGVEVEWQAKLIQLIKDVVELKDADK